jgi:L,D-peptidoglycan transpeptidase YkuD (ErfK/YbiS/YcfS/YnhG family)
MNSLIYFFGAFLMPTLVFAQVECSSINQALHQSKQLVVVLSENWKSPNATIFRYERNEKGAWTRVGEKIEARVGINGMAWGQGLQKIKGEDNSEYRNAHFRYEGHNQSPAGFFTLGSTFGTDPTVRKAELKKGNPYFPVQDGVQCPDDYRSPGYNEIITEKGYPNVPGLKVLGKDQIFDSENMWQMVDSKDPKYGYKGWLPYQLGIVVNHNKGGQKADSQSKTPFGSCIFLHVMHPDGNPTTGCTSMKLGDLKKLVLWRDNRKNPVLIQLPEDQWNDVVRRCGDLPQAVAN